MVKRILGCGTLVLAIAFTISGCKRANGDRCQVDSDCDSNFCAYVGTPTTAIGGTCAPPGTVTPTPDASVDASPDAPPDAAMD